MTRLILISLLATIFASPASEAQVIQTGYRSVLHSFETVTKSLSPDLEESYELFLFINSAEGPTPLNAFLPSQHMLVVGKRKGSDRVFSRDEDNIITDVSRNSLFLSDLLARDFLPRSNASPPVIGLPFDWNGLEILPVSTGTNYQFPTFSGIFQLNWSRSQNMRSRDYNEPMSNALYVGYFYHDDSIDSQHFNEHNRDRVSYLAIHGTPQENWKLLGRSRASQGCARSLPHFIDGLYQYIEAMPSRQVINLDWNYELPQIDRAKPSGRAKPVLIILFNGYESQST